MAEMAAATAAVHFGPRRCERAVLSGAHGVLDGLVETRPTGAALEFRFRREQRQITAGAGERPLAMLFQERTGTPDARCPPCAGCHTAAASIAHAIPHRSFRPRTSPPRAPGTLSTSGRRPGQKALAIEASRIRRSIMMVSVRRDMWTVRCEIRTREGNVTPGRSGFCHFPASGAELLVSEWVAIPPYLRSAPATTTLPADEQGLQMLADTSHNPRGRRRSRAR